MIHVGYIYGYRVRRTQHWRNVGQTTNLSQRHLLHQHEIRGTPFERELHQCQGSRRELEGPVILEKVTGRTARDLDFNLDFQETVWIFKCHTLRSIWPEGLNVRAFHPSGKFHHSNQAAMLVYTSRRLKNRISALAAHNKRSLTREVELAVEEHLAARRRLGTGKTASGAEGKK